VAYAFATILGDVQRGRALLDQAVGDATKAEDLIMLAHYADRGVADSELARELRQKAESGLSDIADFQKIVTAIRDTGDQAVAKAFYKKAARHCAEIPTSIIYAKGALDIFTDRQWAAAILDEAEIECQFPRDFVQLAEAYKSLLADDTKVQEPVAQGAEFAMSGEELLDLAQGCWSPLGDRESTVQAYRQTLKDISDRQQLMAIGETAANDLVDTALAKDAYAKIEGKVVFLLAVSCFFTVMAAFEDKSSASNGHGYRYSHQAIP